MDERFFNDRFLRIEKLDSQPHYEYNFKIYALKEETSELRQDGLSVMKWHEMRTVTARNFDEAYKKYYGY